MKSCVTNRVLARVAAALAIFLLLFSSLTRAASQGNSYAPLTQANFSEVVGSVYVSPSGDVSTKQPVTAGMNYSASETISTGPHSRVQLTAPGGTLARLGSNTVLFLDPGTGALHLQAGSLLFNSPQGGGTGTIVTNSATASLTGTTMIISVSPDGGFKILNLAGTATMKLSSGQTVSLGAGQMSFVLPGAQGGTSGPVLNFDLKKQAQGSGLLNGFTATLPTQSLVADSTQQQQVQIHAGQLTETNQVVLGLASPSQVVLADAYTPGNAPQSNYQPTNVNYNTVHGYLQAIYIQPDLLLGPNMGQTLPADKIFVSPGQTFSATDLNLPPGLLHNDQLVVTGLVGTHVQAAGAVDLSSLDGQNKVDIFAKDTLTVSNFIYAVGSGNSTSGSTSGAGYSGSSAPPISLVPPGGGFSGGVGNSSGSVGGSGGVIGVDAGSSASLTTGFFGGSSGSAISIDYGVTMTTGLGSSSVVLVNELNSTLTVANGGNVQLGGVGTLNFGSNNVTAVVVGNNSFEALGGNIGISNGGTLMLNSGLGSSNVTLGTGGTLDLDSGFHTANTTFNLNTGGILNINTPTTFTATNGTLTLDSGGIQTTINQGDSLTVDSGTITSDTNGTLTIFSGNSTPSLFTAALQSRTTPLSSNSSASTPKTAALDSSTDIVFTGLSSTLKLNLIAQNGFNFDSGITVLADFAPTLFPALPAPGDSLDPNATPVGVFGTEFGLTGLGASSSGGGFGGNGDNGGYGGDIFLDTVTLQNPTGDLKLRSYFGIVSTVASNLTSGGSTFAQSANGAVQLFSTNITTGPTATITISSDYTLPASSGGDGTGGGTRRTIVPPTGSDSGNGSGSDSGGSITTGGAPFNYSSDDFLGVQIDASAVTLSDPNTSDSVVAIPSILQTGSNGNYQGHINILSRTSISIVDTSLFSFGQNIIAGANLTISNTSINPGALASGSKFIYAGDTQSLSGLDFPAGSIVNLYSYYGALNTDGTVVPGDVNFVDGVTYNGGPADSQIGTSILLGLTSDNATVQSALATSVTLDGNTTSLPSANLFANVLFSPAQLGAAPFDINAFQVHGLIAGNLSLGGAIDLTSLPSDSIMLALAAPNITFTDNTVFTPPATPGLRLLAWGNFAIPVGTNISVNFPTSGSSFEFENLHDLDFNQNSLTNVNGTVLVNSLEGNLTFESSTVAAGNDSFAGSVLLNADSDFSTIAINNSTLTANSSVIINAANVTVANSTVSGNGSVILNSISGDINVSASNLTSLTASGQVDMISNGNLSIVNNSIVTAQTTSTTTSTINLATAHVMTVRDSALVGAYSNLEAGDVASLDNVDVSSAQAISIAARTVNLSNINFPSGSSVYLSSQNGLLAPNPNTGASPVVGDVNFITHVLYNGAPAQNFVSPSVGGSSTSGANPIQIGSLPRASHP